MPAHAHSCPFTGSRFYYLLLGTTYLLSTCLLLICSPQQCVPISVQSSTFGSCDGDALALCKHKRNVLNRVCMFRLEWLAILLSKLMVLHRHVFYRAADCLITSLN